MYEANGFISTHGKKLKYISTRAMINRMINIDRASDVLPFGLNVNNSLPSDALIWNKRKRMT
jgi:hypothetical protein